MANISLQGPAQGWFQKSQNGLHNHSAKALLLGYMHCEARKKGWNFDRIFIAAILTFLPSPLQANALVCLSLLLCKLHWLLVGF